MQDTSKDGTEDEIAIIGATGTRYDHAFTNIFVLDESLEAGIRCAIYDKNNKIYLADKSFEIRKDKLYQLTKKIYNDALNEIIDSDTSSKMIKEYQE